MSNYFEDDRGTLTRSSYWQSNSTRDAVRPKIVWKPYQKFITDLVDLRGRQLLDFGAGISSPVVQRFKNANDGTLDGYLAYDIDMQAAARWKSEERFYDFYEDDSRLGSFDIIYSDNSYEHLSLAQREQFLRRAHQLTKPGGKLVMIYPHIANLNIIEHFERDRTHLPVAREHEAGFVSSIGFKSELYLAGLTFPYKPLLFSVKQFLRNVMLGYSPQTTVVIVATRMS